MHFFIDSLGVCHHLAGFIVFRGVHGVIVTVACLHALIARTLASLALSGLALQIVEESTIVVRLMRSFFDHVIV